MDRNLPSLNVIGLKFGTDKSSKEHDYLSFYESLFQAIRHDRITILEIGVLYGASLRVWKEYFPNGTVIGADIDPGVKSYNTARILTEVIDQSNIEDLVQLGVKHGPFDIIIEDGSHQWEHQITTFRTLFPFVKNGGLYIVEDLHTNFGRLAAECRGSSSISFVEYLKKLVDLRVADDQIDISNEEDPFLRTYGRNIQFLTFYRRACIVRKKYQPYPGRISAAETQRSESNDVAHTSLTDAHDTDISGRLSIICHIGNIGNRQSASGAIAALRHDANIQGFVVFGEDSLAGEVEYRARLADGSWTGWVGCGHFVGTKGKSQDLTGFSARLRAPGEKTYTLELVGLFRGQPAAVVVAGGGECVSQTNAKPLYGMQLVIRSKSWNRKSQPDRSKRAGRSLE
jgi:hypothetical protein